MTQPVSRHWTNSLPAGLPTSLLLLAAAAALPLSGCPELRSTLTSAEMPELTLQEVKLTAAPTELDLASYYCHEELDDLADLVCTPLLGRAPRLVDMKLSFDLVFEVDNPNDFDIPLLEMLLELNVFAGQLQRNLGALCVTFCDPDSGEDCELQAAEGCRTDRFPEGGTAGLEIDPVAVVDELIDLVTDEPDDDEEGANQWIRTLPAGGSTQVTVGIQIGASAMLEIIEKVLFSDTNWERMTSGKVPDVKIPYSVRGYLWFDIGRLGRVWLAFGPFGSEWDLLREH